MDEVEQPSDTVAADPHADCQQQLAACEAKWKRARADYENREKEIARERSEYAQFASAGLIRDLLPIGDAIRAAGSDFSAIQKLFDDVLKRQGVEPVGVVGERVDYFLHEVVSTREEEDEDSGVVLEVAQVGYTMHGRLLRPAKVIVSAEQSSS